MRVSRVCGKLMLDAAARSKSGLAGPDYPIRRETQTASAPARRPGALGKAPSMPPPL
jgi:hypothetical protein